MDIGLVSWVLLSRGKVFYVEIKNMSQGFPGCDSRIWLQSNRGPGFIRTPGVSTVSTVSTIVSTIGKSSHLVQVAMDFGHESWFRSKSGPRRRRDAVPREV